jgi:hypothetical protein
LGWSAASRAKQKRTAGMPRLSQGPSHFHGLPLPPVLVGFRPLGGRLVVYSQGPSDLEGLGLGRAAPRPDDPIVAPLRDDPLSLFHLHPARDALAAEALPRNGHVSKILHPVDLRGEVGVDGAQGFPPAPDSGWPRR